MKIAVLDDYQNVALKLADWSVLTGRAEITTFNDHMPIPRLLSRGFFPSMYLRHAGTHALAAGNYRTPPAAEIDSVHRSRERIDQMAAASEREISVTATGYRSTPTIELTWALILASIRHIVSESNGVRAGGWQTTIGHQLEGKALGVVGLGRVGGQVARIGLAFGMKIIAWSQNMTPEIAAAAGATMVPKSELFR